MNEWEILDDNTVYLDKDGNEVKPTDYQGGLFGIGASAPTKYRTVVYANGQIWTSVDDAQLTYYKTDAQLASAFRSKQSAEKTQREGDEGTWSIQTDGEGKKWRVNAKTGEVQPVEGPAGKAESTATAPQVREFPDGSLRQWDPAQNTWTVIGQAPQQGQSAPQVRSFPDGSLRQWDPQTNTWQQIAGPAPEKTPQRAPRYPEEEALDKLKVQAAQRQMQDTVTRARQDHYQAISLIKDMLARGEIDEGEADRLIDLSKGNMDATIKGTTPWQMEKDRMDRADTQRRQRENLAASTIANRMQTGGSLAQGLFSTAAGAYGNILGSTNPPLDFNPLALAQQFINEAGGGQELNEMAKAVLMGAMQQPQEGGY